MRFANCVQSPILLSTGGRGGSQRSNSIGDFCAAQKTFECLKKATKQTECSLVISDMLAIKRTAVQSPVPRPKTC